MGPLQFWGMRLEGLCINFLIFCLLSVCNIFITPTAAYHTPQLERAHKAWPNLFFFLFVLVVPLKVKWIMNKLSELYFLLILLIFTDVVI